MASCSKQCCHHTQKLASDFVHGLGSLVRAVTLGRHPNSSLFSTVLGLAETSQAPLELVWWVCWGTAAPG